jgi:hypothetical protein
MMMVMPLLCLARSSAHFNTDRAWRIVCRSTSPQHDSSLFRCRLHEPKSWGVCESGYLQKNSMVGVFSPCLHSSIMSFRETPLRSFHYEQNNCLSPTSILRISIDRIVFRLLKRHIAMKSYIW